MIRTDFDCSCGLPKGNGADFMITLLTRIYMELDEDDADAVALPTGGELELKNISRSFSDDVGATVDG